MTPTEDLRIVPVTSRLFMLQRRFYNSTFEKWKTLAQFDSERQANEAMLKIKGGIHDLAYNQ